MAVGTQAMMRSAYERAAKLVEDRAKELKVTAVDASRTADAIRSIPIKGE